MLKSALDIALEKASQIGETGEVLTKEQREKIAAINKEYDIKIAELEIKYSTEIKKLRESCGLGEEFAVHAQAIMDRFEQEKARINQERRERIEKVKNEKVDNSKAR